jgi:phage shock protein PspC (stress-responsive transcriptional regulator)
MNKIISINLGGRAYQLEENGYVLLKEYLEKAAERLSSDPDKAEIITDLEQAIAEKINRLMNAGKNVATNQEVETIIKEMGPVESPGEEKEENKKDGEEKKPVKRLYRIYEGKMIAGVCTGLAAYFNIDVVVIRVVFILLTLLTQGAGIIAYIVLLVIVPIATTSEQVAAAHGEPKTAQEFINRAKEKMAEFSDKSEWKKKKKEIKDRIKLQRLEWREKMEKMNWGGCCGSWKNSPNPSGMFIMAFIILWIFGLISIITSGAIFGMMLPIAWPLWAVIIGWAFVFIIITSALSAPKCGNGGCLSALISLGWLTLACYLVWHFIPASHSFFLWFKDLTENIWQHIKD